MPPRCRPPAYSVPTVQTQPNKVHDVFQQLSLFILTLLFRFLSCQLSPPKTQEINQSTHLLSIIQYEFHYDFKLWVTINYQVMGFFKIIAFIAVPITGMTYAAFSLGKELPKASRKFGNYVGLSYVYFKCILKTLKPEDQMPYEMIEMARKASQQSQALRRELRNTVKKAKEDFHRKHQETLLNFQQKIKVEAPAIKRASSQDETSKQNNSSQISGSQVMRQLLQLRNKLAQQKRLKKQSRSFYDKI